MHHLRRADRPGRVVCAQQIGIEKRRQRIAAEFNQVAAVKFNLLHQRRKQTIDDPRNLLGAFLAQARQVFGQRGKARQIGEQQRAAPNRADARARRTAIE